MSCLAEGRSEHRKALFAVGVGEKVGISSSLQPCFCSDAGRQATPASGTSWGSLKQSRPGDVHRSLSGSHLCGVWENHAVHRNPLEYLEDNSPGLSTCHGAGRYRIVRIVCRVCMHA